MQSRRKRKRQRRKRKRLHLWSGSRRANRTTIEYSGLCSDIAYSFPGKC